MFVVIFEVQPRADRFDEYLSLAGYLKPKLEAIDGFVDNERFASRRAARRILSLSTWRDEKAVVRWRTQGEHHRVQGKGRLEIFEDYHLRVGEVTADSAPPRGLAIEQKRFDETEVGSAKLVTITEVVAGAGGAVDLPQDFGLGREALGVVDRELFESIYNPGKLLLLAGWRDAAAAGAWQLGLPEVASLRHREVRIIRDYGMFERREAPQFHPGVVPRRPGAAPSGCA